jgi:competence protein ComFC
MFSEALLQLFFPRLCLACDRTLPKGNSQICFVCQLKLPYTDFHLHQTNNVTDRFWGRVPIFTATAGLYFTKSGRVQRMIHRLKYENKPEIGLELGKKIGYKLKDSPLYQQIDLIIPVPMHPKKEYQRGYNQASKFAEGLSQTMQVPWSKEMLTKFTATETQTRKSREERFDNVASSFTLNGNLQGKHVLLVDDVITTGATLEACASVMLKEQQVTISIAAIALAGG